MDATSGTPWAAAVLGGMSCLAVPMEICEQWSAATGPCEKKDDVCVPRFDTDAPTDAPSFGPTVTPTPCQETPGYWVDAVEIGGLSCTYAPNQVCDDIDICTSYNGACYDQITQCDSATLCNGNGVHPDTFSPDGCDGDCTCEPEWMGSSCGTRVIPTVTNARVADAKASEWANLQFDVTYPNPDADAVFHVFFVEHGQPFDSSDIGTLPSPPICNPLVGVAQTATFSENADCPLGNKGDSMDVYIYTQVSFDDAVGPENYVLSTVVSYRFTWTENCYQLLCGCPDYSGGAAWCSDFLSLQSGTDCQNDEGTCNGAGCSGVWCEPPHDFEGTWRDTSGVLYSGSVITITQDAWSVGGMDANDFDLVKNSVNELVLSHNAGATSSTYTATLTDYNNMSLLNNEDGSVLNAQRVFRGTATLAGTTVGMDVAKFLTECSAAVAPTTCVTVAEGSIIVTFEDMTSDGSLSSVVNSAGIDGLILITFGSYVPQATCNTCAADMISENVCGLEIKQDVHLGAALPTSCVDDIYDACAATVSTQCEAAVCTVCPGEFGAIFTLCQEFIGGMTLNDQLMPATCVNEYDLCTNEIQAICEPAVCGDCKTLFAGNDGYCKQQLTPHEGALELAEADCPTATLEICNDVISDVCMGTICDTCTADFAPSQGPNDLCGQLLTQTPFGEDLPASCEDLPVICLDGLTDTCTDNICADCLTDFSAGEQSMQDAVCAKVTANEAVVSEDGAPESCSNYDVCFYELDC